ncbi:MAG: type IV pilus secretin family protein [Gemmatimonadales bacterium]|nr:MAG: type IV pilus secretin family protein [Gemmatimonadales bacterium]
MTPLFALWTALVMGGTAVGGAVPSEDPSSGTLRDLALFPSADRAELVLEVDGDVEVRDFTMEGPHRLVVDLLGAKHALSKESFTDVQRGGIQSIRASQYDDDVVRVVLQLDLPLEHEVRSGDGFVRVSLENPSGDFSPWEARARAEAPAAPQVDTSGNGELRVNGEAQRPRDRAPSWAGVNRDDLAERISITFVETPMREVLFTFSEFSERSIVPGSGVSGTVNAEIRDQPWDIALQAILESHGLAADERGSGIIRVDALEDLQIRSEVEQLVTRPFRISFANAQDFSSPVESLLSERGRISVSQSTNTLVVTDIPRVLDQVEDLIGGIDVQTPEISISSKIIFVNRTDLEEFGVVYDLKDSRGNQIAGGLAPATIGRVDDDTGVTEFEELGPQTSAVSLGGNSIAALGNANQQVTGAQIQFLTSLVIGRHTLLSFVEALQSVNLSDIQAHPQIRVLENQTARIQVGERTPVPVFQPQTGGQEGQFLFPQQSIQFQDTGIILEVTPQVTAGNLIYMALRAERSGVELADTQVGFIFNTQEAETVVLVEDGETVVLGGLTVTELTEFQAGIPLLMNLPVVGRMFRLTREQRTQQDLMILVTPQINRR